MQRDGELGLVDHILGRLGDDVAHQWQAGDAGTPTRFAVVDDLLPESVAREIYEAFPRDGEDFRTLDTFREHKRQSFDLDRHPAILTEITYALQDRQVIERIGELTGIEGLVGDPTLYAGGLSMMCKGHFLNPHIDNSHEATRSKYRRINVLYYVTPDWREENGGNLELWNESVTRPVTIASKFNRLVLMETNRHSWHSVSPVQVEGRRCCVSNYYFSTQSPEARDYYHVTSYTGRPGQRLQRAAGVIDNRVRQFARTVLGMRRASDAGFRNANVEQR